jgi:Tfp pilus assembly protein PilF
MRPKPAPLTPLLLRVPFLPSVCQSSSGKQEEISRRKRLVQQYLQQQRPDLAIPELQKIIELDPDNVDARGNLGVPYFFRSKLQGGSFPAAPSRS